MKASTELAGVDHEIWSQTVQWSHKSWSTGVDHAFFLWGLIYRSYM